MCLPAALVILAFAWTVHRRFREVSVESSDYWIRIGAVTGILAIALLGRIVEVLYKEESLLTGALEPANEALRARQWVIM